MAGFDPFEGEETITEEPKEAPTKTTRKKTVTKKETPVAEETERGGLSITLKGGPGFEAPWVVLHPKNLDEAEELLSEENRDKLKGILQSTQAASAFFLGNAPEKPAGGRSGGGRPSGEGNRYGAPQAATEHPKGKKEFCSHGEMVFKSGAYRSDGKYHKKGDTFYAFDCPEDICDRKWDNGR